MKMKMSDVSFCYRGLSIICDKKAQRVKFDWYLNGYNIVIAPSVGSSKSSKLQDKSIDVEDLIMLLKSSDLTEQFIRDNTESLIEIVFFIGLQMESIKYYAFLKRVKQMHGVNVTFNDIINRLGVTLYQTFLGGNLGNVWIYRLKKEYATRNFESLFLDELSFGNSIKEDEKGYIYFLSDSIELKNLDINFVDDGDFAFIKENSIKGSFNISKLKSAVGTGLHQFGSFSSPYGQNTTLCICRQKKELVSLIKFANIASDEVKSREVAAAFSNIIRKKIDEKMNVFFCINDSYILDLDLSYELCSCIYDFCKTGKTECLENEEIFIQILKYYLTSKTKGWGTSSSSEVALLQGNQFNSVVLGKGSSKVQGVLCGDNIASIVEYNEELKEFTKSLYDCDYDIISSDFVYPKINIKCSSKFKELINKLIILYSENNEVEASTYEVSKLYTKITGNSLDSRLILMNEKYNNEFIDFKYDFEHKFVDNFICPDNNEAWLLWSSIAERKVSYSVHDNYTGVVVSKDLSRNKIVAQTSFMLNVNNEGIKWLYSISDILKSAFIEVLYKGVLVSVNPSLNLYPNSSISYKSLIECIDIEHSTFKITSEKEDKKNITLVVEYDIFGGLA